VAVGDSLQAVLTRSPRTAPGILAHPFYFQTAPIESFSFEQVAEWLDYSTLGRKRFSRPGAVQLTPFQLDVLFADYLIEPVPMQLRTYVSNLAALGLNPLSIDAISSHPFFSTPKARLKELRRILRSYSPMILTLADSAVLKPPSANSIASNLGEALSLEVTLRNVRQEERAGEPDAVYCTVQFMEYQPLQLTQRRGGAKGTTGTRKLTIKKLADDEITVARLARKFYGDASKVNSIYSLNKPWLKEFGRDEHLRAIALGLVPQTTRNKRLRALLKKHPQIIVPALHGAAATTSQSGAVYLGATGL
jgi:hypothetical protein